MTICRIAVDLLKEQPDFSHRDKLESFLRHLSVEAGVQVEVQYLSDSLAISAEAEPHPQMMIRRDHGGLT